MTLFFLPIHKLSLLFSTNQHDQFHQLRIIISKQIIFFCLKVVGSSDKPIGRKLLCIRKAGRQASVGSSELCKHNWSTAGPPTPANVQSFVSTVNLIIISYLICYYIDKVLKPHSCNTHKRYHIIKLN